MLLAQRVFVFIKMNEHIADFSTFVTHSIVGGAVQIADFWVSLEQMDERRCKSWLSCAFLAVDVQYRERACPISDNVTKQCAKVNADCCYPIVSILLMKQRKVFLGR